MFIACSVACALALIPPSGGTAQSTVTDTRFVVANGAAVRAATVATANPALQNPNVQTRLSTPKVKASATELDLANVWVVNPTLGKHEPSMLLIRNRIRTVVDAKGRSPSRTQLYRLTDDQSARSAIRRINTRAANTPVSIGNVFIDRRSRVREVFNLVDIRRGLTVRN